MAPTTRYPGDVVAVVGRLLPTVQANNTVTTSRVRLGDFHSYMVVLSVASVQTSLDAKIVQYDAASGGNSKDLPNAAITQLGGDDDNVVVVIEFDGIGFDTPNGYQWFALSATAVGTVFSAAVVLGVHPRSGAAIEDQSVFERVVV